ncbi:ribose-5-phosphate isomerase RpiA [Paenibacillus aestuarii]|uniref:Ribose-5-phosphate isomerase A n=1 Tax=Paenibacillus aestuarii TaxID=516965 RepID=A0ABW0KCW2_9BACL|nr:ribose-5-phosphate isomerase RpiA [Paenibacillus aestuarii]
MNEKQLAGEKAVEFVKSGMILGLGTGSTVYFTIVKIGELVKNGLQIKAVSTSAATTHLAESLGIPLVSINEVESIDLTIDGADEVDKQFNAIKGGGGALFFEKVVALASKQVIWVVDSRKRVEQLGQFPLPVEVTKFGHTHVLSRLAALGLNPAVRKVDGQPYLTDSGNYIIDLHIGKIERPSELNDTLNAMTGVVEHGLFLKVAQTVIVGSNGAADVLSC